MLNHDSNSAFLRFWLIRDQIEMLILTVVREI